MDWIFKPTFRVVGQCCVVALIFLFASPVLIGQDGIAPDPAPETDNSSSRKDYVPEPTDAIGNTDSANPDGTSNPGYSYTDEMGDVNSCCPNNSFFGNGIQFSKRFEIGLNGAEGNSRNLNLVVGYDSQIKFGLNSFDLDIDYFYAFDEDEVTKNRFLSLKRYIREIPGSQWDLLFDNWFEYDELEDFKARIGFHGGGIYTFVDSDPLVLKGIIGLGTSKEFEGTDQGWRPEGILGGIWERNIADTQKLYIKTALYPNLEDTSSYRWNTKAGWEITLDPENNLKFNISCFDRYDSTPSDGDRRNNIDYWASLLIAF